MTINSPLKKMLVVRDVKKLETHSIHTYTYTHVHDTHVYLCFVFNSHLAISYWRLCDIVFPKELDSSLVNQNMSRPKYTHSGYPTINLPMKITP